MATKITAFINIESLKGSKKEFIVVGLIWLINY